MLRSLVAVRPTLRISTRQLATKAPKGRTLSTAPAEVGTSFEYEEVIDWLAAEKPVAPAPASLSLFKSGFKAPVIEYAQLAKMADAHEHLLRAVMDPGCVIIDGVPEGSLEEVMGSYLGSGKAGAAESTPGLLLGVQGAATHAIADGFAVGYALRERKPAFFDALAKFGMASARDKATSPLLHLDSAGHLLRVQSHAKYRTPLAVPFGDVGAYFAAYKTFYDMARSEEFVASVAVKPGQLAVFNNWRVLHGGGTPAAEGAALVGGTIKRDAFVAVFEDK